jgi:DNA invertase Pin-like site-specific DNA recombinase
VQVIDTDLGHTASTTAGRIGFQELVAQVALGEVGILLAYDATRLARNCSHWYQLLDLCGRTDCLIADRDGVYDPGSINGRLLLGLKGQISELELHTIRARLTAGILSKAERGELAIPLPTGLVRLDSGLVVKHPDLAVQGRLEFIFQTLLEKRSINQVVRFFHGQQLKIPCRDRFGEIQWQPANVSRIRSIVKNPAYAGAFAFGRSRSEKDGSTGKRRPKRLPRAQWKICLRDKYPAYISWETFEKIDDMLRDNYSEYERRLTRGVPREGKALLQGIVYCGECGHKLVVQYKGGTRYLCNSLHQQLREAVCQCLPADPIDDQVVRWFFEALSVAEINVAADALLAADQQSDQVLATRRQEVQRLWYDARLAERQYRHTDPENRLVAAELERRWEATLRDLKEAEDRLHQQEQQVPCWAIPADLLESLKEVGSNLPELWSQGLFSASQKKSLLRALIDKVVVSRVCGDRIRTRVVWRGGATTSGDVPMRVASFGQLMGAKEMEEAILRLTRQGQTDEQIAQSLTTQGYRSPRRDVVLTNTVRMIRLKHGVFIRDSQSHPHRVPGYLTVSQLADALQVPRNWFYDRIASGTIRITKDASTGSYLFPDNPETIRQFRQLREGLVSHLDY